MIKNKEGYTRPQGKASRVETFTNGFKAGSWHEFEAKYKINSVPKGGKGGTSNEIAIAQVFANDKGPELIIHIHKDGKLDYGSNGNKIISNKNWIGKEFTLKLRTNGKDLEGYLNGDRFFKGKNNDTGKNQEHSFRWGLYYNYIMDKDVSSEVRVIKVN